MPQPGLETYPRSQVGIPSKRGLLVAALVLLTALHLIPVFLEVPTSGTDVFLFKEAGVNLAQSGHFAARNLVHQPPDKTEVFAYYPPVYPFVYGLWSRVAGVGIKQSLAFDNLIRIFRTLLLFLLLVPTLKRSKEQTNLWFITLLLFAWSFLTTECDRPDDLGVLWGLAAWNVLFAKPFRGRIAIAGLLLGLCAATSPAAGAFFTAIAAGSLLLNGFTLMAFVQIAILASCSLTLYTLCTFPIYLSDPLAYARFKIQVPLSTFPYLVPLRLGWGWMAAYYRLREHVALFLALGSPFLVFLGGLVMSALLLIKTKPEKSRLPYRYLVLMSILFAPACLMVWTLQPFYLWFGITGLLLGVLALLVSATPRIARCVRLLILFGLVPLLAREFKVYSAAWQRTEGDSVEQVQDRVLAYVEPLARMAVTPDQYFTFRGVREVANVFYVCDRIEQYDYLYVTRHQDLSVLAPEPTPIPCETQSSCFKVVRDFSSHATYKIFGFSLPYYLRGNGGVLYKNSCTS